MIALFWAGAEREGATTGKGGAVDAGRAGRAGWV